MKKLFSLALVLGFVVVTAHISYATHVQMTAGAVAGGIEGSRHNFSSSGVHWRTGTTLDNRSNDLADGKGTTEICVFCHTPHHGSTGDGPLWNKQTGTGSYGAYGTTIGGSDLDSLPTSGASLACLACHDGTAAWDNIINAPGQGTWTGTGWSTGISGTGVDMGWAFSEDGNAGGNLHSDTVSSRHNLARGGGLANDHPINVVYVGEDTDPELISGARASLRATDVVLAEVNLATEVQGPSLVCNDTGGTEGVDCNLWAVNGFIKIDATIQDLLKAGNKVECSSCHDPHYRNTSNPEIDTTCFQTSHSVTLGEVNDCDGLFLRRVGGNSDSGVCRTCHAK